MVHPNKVLPKIPIRLAALVCGASLCLAAGPAYAYIGPGVGLTAIGTVSALFGAVALAIVGFFWYPVKRLIRRLRSLARRPEPTTGTDGK